MNKKIQRILICMACGLMTLPLMVQASNEMSSEQDKMVIAQSLDNQQQMVSEEDIEARLAKKAAEAADMEDKAKYRLMNQIINADDVVLTVADLNLANLIVNEPLPANYGQNENEMPMKNEHFKGEFVTYNAEQGSFTVYDKTELKNTIANVHIDKEDDAFTTKRKVKVGDQRGAVILEYGAPNAIWQSPGTGQMVYWYEVPMDEGKKGYLVFTMENMKVKAIDTFAQGIENKASWPKLNLRHYKADELADSDFSLLGYRLGDKYIPAKGVQREWNRQGEINYLNYTASNDGIIVYDEDYQVSRVILTLGNSVTRRGVGVGSNVVLMFKTYGLPTRIVEDFAFKGEKGQVAYEYENPYINGEYLIFVVNGEDDFIDAIILSNLSIEKINMYQDEEKAKNLIYRRIASVRKAN